METRRVVMSVSVKSFFVFWLILISTAVYCYKPVGEVQKKHRTLAEKVNLFKKVGCKYSDKVEVVDPQHFQNNPKKNEYYISYKAMVDQDSKKYASAVKDKKNAKMYLQWISDIVGYGVYADQDIQPGDYIGEYTGVLRPIKDNDNLDYAWYYTLDGPDGKSLVVDGKKQGNELRFINHANDPNLKLVSVLGDDGAFHLAYVAQKGVPKGQQLTVSYGSGYWECRGINPVNFSSL